MELAVSFHRADHLRTVLFFVFVPPHGKVLRRYRLGFNCDQSSKLKIWVSSTGLVHVTQLMPRYAKLYSRRHARHSGPSAMDTRTRLSGCSETFLLRSILAKLWGSSAATAPASQPC